MKVNYSRLLTDSEMEMLHEGALDILWNMGVKIESDRVLDILEKKGIKIDKAKQVARFSRKFIENVIKMAHRDNTEQIETLSTRFSEETPKGYRLPSVRVSSSGNCPLYYDDKKRERRLATQEDQIKMMRLCYALPEVVGVSPMLIDTTCPVEIEVLKSIKLVIENAAPNIHGTDLFSPEQVEYAAEMGRIFANDPVRFLQTNNCPNSPLTYSKRIAEIALAKAKYDLNSFCVTPMPISGLNAPVTRAGTIIQSLAEILGGWAMGKSLNERVPVLALPLTGALDMATGVATFGSPDVVVQDIGIYEVCKYLYGATAGIYVSYADAKKPGMQAVYEKTFKQMAFIPYVPVGDGVYNHDGTLANALVFSPTQLMIDIETNRALCHYLKGIEINKEELAIDAIKEIGWQKEGYIFSKHTLKNFKKVMWFPRLLDRTEWRGTDEEKKKEKYMLERAEELWRDALKTYEPPKVDVGIIKALDDVVKRAEKKLVGRLG